MAHGQISLERRPNGWLVQTQETGDGLFLYWHTPIQVWQDFLAKHLMIWIALGIFCWFLVDAGGLGQVAGVILFVVWFTAAALDLQEKWNLRRTRLPEAILLGADWFGYFPGAAPRPRLIPRPWITPKLAVDVKRIVALPAADLAPFEIKPSQSRRRIFFQHGDRSAEIGVSLNVSERLWLYDVLEKWRQGTDLQHTREPAEINHAIADWVKHWSDPNRTGIMDMRRRQ